MTLPIEGCDRAIVVAQQEEDEMFNSRPVDRRYALTRLGAVSSLLAFSLPAKSVAQATGAIDKAILQGAAKEGQLTLLMQTSLTDETLGSLIKRFNEHYPFIKVSYTLQNTVQIMNRFSSELAGKRGISDVVLFPANLTEIGHYAASGALARYVPTQDAAFPAGTKQPGQWYAVASDCAVTAYRKGAVSDEEKKLLRTYKGLGDPRFKGRIGINGVTNSLSVTAAYALLTNPDPGLWQRLAANNPRVKTASPALMDGLLAGEYDIALFLSAANSTAQARSGAPIEFGHTALSPTVYVPIAISTLAPHPNAARLWQDWVTSKEGQDLWVGLVGHHSVRADTAKPWADRQPWYFGTPGTHPTLDWVDFNKKQDQIITRFKKDLQSG